MKIIDASISPISGKKTIPEESRDDVKLYMKIYFERADKIAYMKDSELIKTYLVKKGNIGDAVCELSEGPVKKVADNIKCLLDDAGISRAVFCGYDAGSVGRRMLANEYVAKLQERYPDRFIVLAGVNPHKGLSAVREFEYAVKELGLKGLRIAPFELEIYPTDRRMYLLYEKCVELDVPCFSHCSVNFVPSCKMEYGHPRYLDEVASDFPELKIIISHGGNGFGPPILAVAQRHPNVYLEFSALRPKYMAPEFIQAANTYLKKKCIFGTDYPLIEFQKQIDLWKYALREENWKYFFRENILNALNKEPIPYK